jgi:hypothetical protein
VDQDRDVRRLRDLEDRLGCRIAEPEGLRSRAKLDPARAKSQAALCLAHRILSWV